MLGWHIVLKLVDGSVIASTPARRRRFARIVLEQGRDRGLVAFRAPDEHAHLFATCTRADAGQFAREVEIAAQHALLLPVPFVPAYFRPVEDQRHGYHVLRYVLTQDRHHRIDADPFHDASNLPDLLGLRLCGRYTEAHARQLLPRVRREELLEWLGAPRLVDSPLALAELADAAAAALGLADLRGRSGSAVAGRSAAIQLTSPLLATHELAALLRLAPSGVRRLRHHPRDPELVRAIDLQLRLRSAVALPSFVPVVALTAAAADHKCSSITAPMSSGTPLSVHSTLPS